MAVARSGTFSLDSDEASYLDRLVATGIYASGNDVLRAGLRALRDNEATVERWLREEVVPVAMHMQAQPDRSIPAEQVFEEIRDLHRDRAKA